MGFSRKFFWFLAVFLVSNPAWAGLQDPTLPYSNRDNIEIVNTEKEPHTKDRTIRIEIRDLDYSFDVYQRLDHDFVNAGQNLGASSIEFQTNEVSGSGTLYAQSGSKYLSEREELIFRSPNTVQSSDVFNFDVIFRLLNDRVQNIGRYDSRIRYILRGRSQSTNEEKTINIYVYADASSVSVDVETNSGSNRTVILNEESGDKLWGSVKFSFKGLGAKSTSISQTVEADIANSYQERLDGLKFLVNSTGGETVAEPELLNRVQLEQKIAKSINLSDDSQIEIVYFLDTSELSKYRAGRYFGRVRYNLELSDGQVLSIPMDIRLDIDPIFDIKVVEGRNVNFASIKADKDPVSKVVSIEVNSNLKKPYYVIQKLDNPLITDMGASIGEDFFTVRQQLSDESNGTVIYKEATSVKNGDTVIFHSDDSGSSSAFSLEYTLTATETTKAGNYMTNISYSLMEK